MGKFFKEAPVIWSAKTLENIGKPNYQGVAAALSATKGRGVRQKPHGGKQ